MQKRKVGENSLDWDDVRTLISVIRHGNLSVAAQELQLSPSAVSRKVDAIERKLGSSLFFRGNFGASPAHWLRGLEEECRRLEGSFTRFSRVLASAMRAEHRPHREIHVAVHEMLLPVMFAAEFEVFAASLPNVTLTVEIVDLANTRTLANADIAVLPTGTMPDAFLCSRVGEIAVVLAAAPRYMQTYGIPEDAPSLAMHRLVVAEDWVKLPESAPWAEAVDGGATVVVKTRAQGVAMRAIRAGVGLGLVALADAVGLVPLSEIFGVDYPVWIGYPAESKGVPEIEAVLDFLRASLRQSRGERILTVPPTAL